jgi:hypothetical protein
VPLSDGAGFACCENDGNAIAFYNLGFNYQNFTYKTVKQSKKFSKKILLTKNRRIILRWNILEQNE